MLIIEHPYASDTIFKTASEQGFPVLCNNAVKELNNKKYNLKILDELSAINSFKTGESQLLYTNSENSIDWILTNLPNSQIAKNIKLFKNKTKFRELLSDIYPNFFFKEIPFCDLDKISCNELKFPFVIKPTVGFLSFGVYTVKSQAEWHKTVEQIKNDINKISNVFPQSVVDSSAFIIEELIDGEEYAVDVYYNDKKEPIILNIFKHPFLNEKDVSDRIYITSKDIIKENMEPFKTLLSKIGELSGLKNFPMHIELRKNSKGEIIPIEVNPMRFAGWCTTDMAIGAYGINVYEHYFNQTKPDWEKILEENDGKICYFAMAEVGTNIDKTKIKEYDYNALCENFSEIYELRKIDYKSHPLFAIIFGRTKDYKEVKKILSLNPSDYIKY